MIHRRTGQEGSPARPAPSTRLAQAAVEYWVMGVPTLVIFVDGRENCRFQGLRPVSPSWRSPSTDMLAQS